MASRAKASGYVLTPADAPIILGMVARDDRDHDIAAWFGVNQGRIAEVKDGKFGTPGAAPANTLPPSGPPGVKGRRLRAAVASAIQALGKNNTDSAKEILATAIEAYDENEA